MPPMRLVYTLDLVLDEAWLKPLCPLTPLPFVQVSSVITDFSGSLQVCLPWRL